MKSKNTFIVFALCMLILVPEIHVFAAEQISIDELHIRKSATNLKVVTPMINCLDQNKGLTSLECKSTRIFSERHLTSMEKQK